MHRSRSSLARNLRCHKLYGTAIMAVRIKDERRGCLSCSYLSGVGGGESTVAPQEAGSTSRACWEKSQR